MPRPIVADAQPNWAGGLNTTADDSELAENECRRASEGRLTEFGAITRRLGTQRTHASAIGSGNIVRGGYSWQYGSTVQQLAISNGVLNTGTYAIPMTWNAEAGSVSTIAVPSFAAFYETAAEACYIADGGLLNKWDGTTFTNNIAGTPAVTQIAVYNLRLFGCGASAAPQSLYWSALSNGDTLGNAGSGGGVAIVRTFAQQDLTGLLPLGSSLLLLHRAGISRFTGWSQDDIDIDGGTQGVSADVGTLAPRTGIAVENFGYILSDRGIYRITESGVERISQKIESVIAGLDQTKFPRAFSVHNRARREVLFYLPDIGIYAYNYRLDAWSGPWTGKFTSKVTHSMWSTLDATSAPIWLWGGSDGFVRRGDAPSIYLDDVLSDGTGGSSYTLAAQAHRFYFGDPISEKSLRFAYVQSNLRGSANAAVEWSTGTGAGSKTLSASNYPIWGSGTWGTFIWGGAGSDAQRVQVHGRGNYADFTFSDSGSVESVCARLEAQAFDMTRRF